MALTPSSAIFDGYCWAVAPMMPRLDVVDAGAAAVNRDDQYVLSLPAAFSASKAPTAAGSLMV